MKQSTNLLGQGVEIINQLVEQCSFEDAHFAIGKLRSHLEARAAQTAPLDSVDDDTDLL